MEQYLPWLTLICLIIQAIVTPLAAWLATRERRRQANDKALREQVNGIDDRVRGIESELKHLPGPEKFEILGKDIERLSGQIHGVEKLLERNEIITNRLETYLLNKGA